MRSPRSLPLYLMLKQLLPYPLLLLLYLFDLLLCFVQGSLQVEALLALVGLSLRLAYLSDCLHLALPLLQLSGSEGSGFRTSLIVEASLDLDLVIDELICVKDSTLKFIKMRFVKNYI